MKIRISPIDPRTHRLHVDRAPHPAIDVALESRSFLLHDLAHYAIEWALGTEDGFWGLLARGHDPALLREASIDDPAVYARLMAIERQVTRLQSAFKRDPDEAATRPGGPELRRLFGAWRKVRQGQTLALAWPPHEPEVHEG